MKKLQRLALWWVAKAWRGPMSHSLVSSGRVELEYRLVTGMAPIAIALMREMHPVSERYQTQKWRKPNLYSYIGARIAHVHIYVVIFQSGYECWSNLVWHHHRPPYGSAETLLEAFIPIHVFRCWSIFLRGDSSLWVVILFELSYLERPTDKA